MTFKDERGRELFARRRVASQSDPVLHGTVVLTDEDQAFPILVEWDDGKWFWEATEDLDALMFREAGEVLVEMDPE